MPILGYPMGLFLLLIFPLAIFFQFRCLYRLSKFNWIFLTVYIKMQRYYKAMEPVPSSTRGISFGHLSAVRALVESKACLPSSALASLCLICSESPTVRSTMKEVRWRVAEQNNLGREWEMDTEGLWWPSWELTRRPSEDRFLQSKHVSCGRNSYRRHWSRAGFQLQ